jgi:ubiquinone biosynthesis monooxygenase Coq7
MKEDEIHHATVALEAGGANLPAPIKVAMKLTSKLMTKSVYYL